MFVLTSFTNHPAPESQRGASAGERSFEHISAEQVYKDAEALDKTPTSHLPLVILFYGFSGPAEKDNGFEVWARRAGAACGLCVTVHMADIENGIDLADDVAWKDLAVRLATDFDGSLWSPPCSTFSAARTRPGGPPLLCGHCGKDLYGLPSLRPSDKEKVRVGTLLALRAAQGIDVQKRAGKPWILETPSPRPRVSSVFSLPEVQDACGPDHFDVD